MNATIDFEGIRVRNPLPEYCERHGIRLRRPGGALVSRCPLHNERHGEAFVVFDDGRWHCFGKCGKSGDVTDLEQALGGGTRAEAAEGHSMLVKKSDSSIVRVELTTVQTEQLAPLVQQAAAESRNSVFISTAIPFWRNGATVWELQVTLIPARIGYKISKLVDLGKGGINAPRPDRSS